MASSGDRAQSFALVQLARDLPRYSSYQPLDPTKREVRLLEIDNENLTCYLRHASLNDGPEYTALSYCWGPPSDLRPLTLDGRVLMIRKTLHQFLKSLYRQFGPLTVWLDVLCINQHDVAEQSQQVAIMREIYKQASCVSAWLGKGDPDTDYAMTHFNRGNPAAVLSAYELDMVWSGLKQLFLRQYWTRVWILPECFLNNVVYLVCGRMTIGLDELFDCAHRLETARSNRFLSDPQRGIGSGRDDVALAWKRVEQIETGRLFLRSDTKSSLLELAIRFADSDCQDPRDKFYCFRALAHDGQQLSVDYSLGPAEVLRQVFSMHNWNSFIAWCDKGADSKAGQEYAPGGNRHKTPWWRQCSSAPAGSSISGSVSDQSLLLDSHFICQHLRLLNEHVLDGLEGSSNDWLVLPIDLYELRRPLPDVLFMINKYKLQDTGIGKFAALWDNPGPGTSRYRVLERMIGDSPYGFQNEIMIDVDIDSATITNTAFTADAIRNLVHWSQEIRLRQLPAQPANLLHWQRHPSSEIRERVKSHLALLEAFQAVAKGHVWLCRVTEAVHISRYLLFVLTALRGSNWSTIPATLLEAGQRRDSGQGHTCQCIMPVGKTSPCPSPWPSAECI